MENIDFVLMWVDSNDQNWQSIFRKHKGLSAKDSSNSARFRDMETLRYVFRCIEKNLPWFHKIHFITMGHLPSWLNTEHKKLEIHKHADLFKNKQDLPTFNSSAIEVNILNIKNLSEKFVLFNDDTLIIRPTPMERFFRGAVPCDFLIQNPLKGRLVSLFFPKNTWVKNISKNIELINELNIKSHSQIHNLQKYLNKEYGFWGNIKNLLSMLERKYVFFEHYHHPQPHLKSTWKKVSEIFPEEIEKTSSHKFRSDSDITQYLFRYWNLINGKFFPTWKKDFVTINISSYSIAKKCQRILVKKNFVCLNDVPELSDIEFLKSKKLILNTLEELFPVKSSFEL